MIVVFILICTFWKGIVSLKTSGYSQTLVIEDKCFQSSFKEITNVRSSVYCSVYCSKESRCKMFMYCKASTFLPNRCIFYDKGIDCVVREGTGTGCECFVQEYSNCESGQCECPVGKYGIQCQDTIKDCGDTSVIDLTHLDSQVAFIKPTTFSQPFPVKCDFGSKLTFFQHRMASCTRINFNRSYVEYSKGFGNVDAEYWLGLEKIYAILQNWPDPKMDVGMFSLGYTQFKQSVYVPFVLGNASTGYEFHSQTCYCNRGVDALLSAPSIDGRPFSTFDNDYTSLHKCPRSYGGGWWYADDTGCTNANPNGPYNTSPYGLAWINVSNGNLFDEFFMRILFS